MIERNRRYYKYLQVFEVVKVWVEAVPRTSSEVGIEERERDKSTKWQMGFVGALEDGATWRIIRGKYFPNIYFGEFSQFSAFLG